jgi:hypothetical protein
MREMHSHMLVTSQENDNYHRFGDKQYDTMTQNIIKFTY